MESLYLLILGALIVLAMFDLVVGVSNDAVNFLNSAIGSKAIGYKTIMIIASAGIFIGAAYSGGLMEIARKGIFNPSQFSFDDVMVIFMAVMIADVLLLDFFNTLGLPTSTTVSIVFNLLGASVAIAIVKMVNQGEGVEAIWNYINTKEATKIIRGIFLSVLIAFSVGALVQFVSRLLFTFQYEKKMKLGAPIFGGISLASIVYFIFIKGLKGSPVGGNIQDMVDGNELYIILGSLVFFTIFSYIIHNVLKKNILVFIIGVGTFGLALAFSGNDLVNFIGVPMAALDSFYIWTAAGSPDPFTFPMVALAENDIKANSWILMIAGLIMVTTLWFSKKARSVAETEISLSRQDEGREKFNPNWLSRIIVKGATVLNNGLVAIVPAKTLDSVNMRFTIPEIAASDKVTDGSAPAFDQIRACINLVVSGILIAFATSQKLPLSTTYVTFMVAMGSSLADRAWGRESAVYRVAGVMHVIGGWFSTAIIAFVAAGSIAFLIHLGGPTGKFAVIAVLLVIAAVILLRNYFAHKRKNVVIVDGSHLKKGASKTIIGIIEESADNIANTASRTSKIYANVIKGLSLGEEKSLKKSRAGVTKLDAEVEDLRNGIFYFIKNLEETSLRGSSFYIRVLSYLDDITKAMDHIAKSSYKHVHNNHKPLRLSQIRDLQDIESKLLEFLQDTEVTFKTRNYSKFNDLLSKKEALLIIVNNKIEEQITRTRTEENSPKNTTLYFGLLLDSKKLVEAIEDLLEVYNKESNR